MNAMIETLNRWGEQALRFAWAMLWQSSLVIALLFVLDWMLAQKVRAAVRYALWLAVLVKLLLPPSLALPTGLGWWLRPAALAAVPPTPIRVTYGPATLQALPLKSGASPMPRAGLSLSGIALAGWGFVSLILLIWLLRRWRQAESRIRSTLAAPVRLEAMVEDIRQRARWRRPVRIRLIEHAVSPAICGLARPVLLLSRPLMERLRPEQLRAVLWHELVHLRRLDVWVSFAQTLLQLVYWWHPLLWMANARIRRLREEAVDDTVMLGLRDEAEAYASTLLEVAKLACGRPLAGLALVGIFESRRALRQRIERLIDFKAPTAPGLTLASCMCVLAFSCLALPMGQSPGGVRVSEASAINNPTGGITPPIMVAAESSGSPEPESGYPTPPVSPNPTSPQINIKVSFVELPDASLTALLSKIWPTMRGNDAGTNWTAELTPQQARDVAEAIHSDANANLLSQMSVTTLSGRQAEMQCVDVKTVIMGINPRALTPPGVIPNSISTNADDPNALYLAESRPFGPTLDLVAQIGSDGRSIHMSLSPSLTEFLGYDHPTNSVPVYLNGRKEQVTPALPHFRVRKVSAPSADVRDQDTLVICDLVAENVAHLNQQIPILGDLPLIGSLFRSESISTSKKHLFVLITPRLLDSAGKPIHGEE